MVGMVSPLSWADLNALNAEQPDGPAPITQTRLADEEVDIVGDAFADEEVDEGKLTTQDTGGICRFVNCSEFGILKTQYLAVLFSRHLRMGHRTCRLKEQCSFV
jgi:hypothetical protein